MFHSDIKGRSYGNERVEISRESDYCLEFGGICVLTLRMAVKNIMRRSACIVYLSPRFYPSKFSSQPR